MFFNECIFVKDLPHFLENIFWLIDSESSMRFIANDIFSGETLFCETFDEVVNVSGDYICKILAIKQLWDCFWSLETLPLLLKEGTYILAMLSKTIKSSTLFMNLNFSKYLNAFGEKRNMFRFWCWSSNDPLVNKVSNVFSSTEFLKSGYIICWNYTDPDWMRYWKWGTITHISI